MEVTARNSNIRAGRSNRSGQSMRSAAIFPSSRRALIRQTRRSSRRRSSCWSLRPFSCCLHCFPHTKNRHSSRSLPAILTSRHAAVAYTLRLIQRPSRCGTLPLQRRIPLSLRPAAPVPPISMTFGPISTTPTPMIILTAIGRIIFPRKTEAAQSTLCTVSTTAAIGKSLPAKCRTGQK